MTTLRDVARRAEVSTSTASHVINGTREVSDKLRTRVTMAIRDLDYEPNAVARSLRTQRSAAIGLVIADISNPFFAHAVRGIEAAASQRGYNVFLCDSDEDPVREAGHISDLRSRRVDGLIVVPTSTGHEQLSRAIDAGLPIVFLDREIPELDVSTAILDNEHAAYVAVRHLAAHGHRRIAIIEGRTGVSFTSQQLAGYSRALQENGIELDAQYVVPGGHTVEGSAAAMRTLLGRQSPPTAVLAASDHPTIGALLALREAGRSVPGDVAVVGYSDSEWCDIVRPRLTAIARPTYQLGQAAATLLFDQWATGVRPTTRRVVLRCDLIVRESCGDHATAQRPRAELPAGSPAQRA